MFPNWFITYAYRFFNMASLMRGRISLVNGRTLSKLLNKHSACTKQLASISSKAFREMNGIKRPPPYDYQNKGYNLINSWFDKTSKRLDDNSKVFFFKNVSFESSDDKLTNNIWKLDNFSRRPNCSGKNWIR